MIVYEFNGKKECNNLIELQEVLKHRSKGNSNEFELRTELEYPFLTILIKEELMIPVGMATIATPTRQIIQPNNFPKKVMG